MVLPEPYFSLSDSRDTSCAIRFFSEPVPQLRDSWDNTWCYRKPRRCIILINNDITATSPDVLADGEIGKSYKMLLITRTYTRILGEKLKKQVGW